jgi:hypothetical protein
MDEITYDDFAPMQSRKHTPKVETSIRSISIRVYLNPTSEDYDACAQLQIYGAKAWMHSITGPGFYLAMDKIIATCRSMGIKELSGYVVPAHARLMRQMAKKADVPFTTGSTDNMDGHNLTWVTWTIG